MKHEILLDIQSVADTLSLSVKSVRRLINLGELKSTKVGPKRKSVRVLGSSVSTHIRSGQETPNTLPRSGKHF